MSDDITVQVTVWEIAVDPQGRDPQRPYLVRLRIDEVYEGDLSQDRVSLLIADVAGTFRGPDPVGGAFVITMATPVTEPYTGRLDVSPSDDGPSDDGPDFE